MEYRKQNTSTYLRCLSGWWFQPLWKIVISQLGIRKIKNVPNHQPAIIYCISTTPHLARCCWVTPLPPFAWSWLWRRSHFLQRPIRRPAALAAGGCRAKGLFRSRKKEASWGDPVLGDWKNIYIYIYATWEIPRRWQLYMFTYNRNIWSTSGWFFIALFDDLCQALGMICLDLEAYSQQNTHHCGRTHTTKTKGPENYRKCSCK